MKATEDNNMQDDKQNIFARFGRLDTWVVGIQYYDGAKGMDSREVFFDRETDNPFDSNAVAVSTRDGRKIGHLPHYDAEYFSPLIADGVVALKGQTGEPERGDRLPLSLEIFATSKVSEVLVHDPRNDWRSIYHNLFIALWERLGDYSSASLEEFRDRFRPVAHEQALYPKTQFLYRMLKAHIAELRKQEETRLRDQVLAAVAAMSFGRPEGWPEMAVITLDATGSSAPSTGGGAAAGAALAVGDLRMSEVLRMLPSLCPYPVGAHGAVVLVHGRWFSLDWFEAPECAQIYWYQMILAGVEEALRSNDGHSEDPDRATPDARTAILEILGHAACSANGTEEEVGLRVDIRAGEYAGNAICRGAALVRLRVCEAGPEVIIEKTRPNQRPEHPFAPKYRAPLPQASLAKHTTT